MEISQQQAGAWVELHVTGRLDSYWSSDFKTRLNDLVRAGTIHIRVNLSGVTYLSSAGLGVLIAGHKQLQGIRGKLEIVNPSAAVKEILSQTRVDTLLATAAPPPRALDSGGARTGMFVERPKVTFGLFDLAREARLTCRLSGDPALLTGCRFTAEQCQKVRFPATTFGVGLGAMGHDFADCQGRFGEFLAAAGAAAYLPTDGTNVPDYLVATGTSVPELQVCYGLLCEGKFARQVRFEAKAEARSVPLSELAAGCLELSGSQRIGLVLLAESAGLMGAALRRSPALPGAGEGPFAYPQVRDWLSFTAERAYPRSLALVVGVALRGDAGPLAPFVRPLGSEAGLLGHCHAVAFSYRPLPRGDIDLRATVASLFEQETLQGILHLLADTRPTLGLGESEFLRGTCWFGPIGELVEDRP